MTTIVVKPKALAGDRRAGGRVNQRDDRTNRNGQRGRVRATSVLGNTKSNRHRKAHRVESGGTSRKSMHLTRGELSAERWAEVSRGHSSLEGRESGWSEGPKAQRDRLAAGLRSHSRSCPKGREHNAVADGGAAGGFRRTNQPRAARMGRVEGRE